MDYNPNIPETYSFHIESKTNLYFVNTHCKNCYIQFQITKYPKKPESKIILFLFECDGNPGDGRKMLSVFLKLINGNIEPEGMDENSKAYIEFIKENYNERKQNKITTVFLEADSINDNEFIRENQLSLVQFYETLGFVRVNTGMITSSDLSEYFDEIPETETYYMTGNINFIIHNIDNYNTIEQQKKEGIRVLGPTVFAGTGFSIRKGGKSKSKGKQRYSIKKKNKRKKKRKYSRKNKN